MASFPSFQVTEGEWKSATCVGVLGLRFPSRFAPDPQLLCDFILNFETRSDDVFVVGFPKKSGTTWMQEIVWQILHEGEVNDTSTVKRVPFLEGATHPQYSMQAAIETMPSPRLLKTHFTYDALTKDTNKNTKCKYVYIARNPKDVAVSYFKFVTARSSLNGFNGPWEFFVKLFLEGNVAYGPWNDHILGWWKHKDEPNVLFLKYEDLQKDLLSHVRRIASFLNKPLSDDLISRIAEQCTFSGMKKNAASFSLPTKDGGTSLLRKGVVGDWKNYFTPELNERFENEVLAKLKGTGLEFDFEI